MLAEKERKDIEKEEDESIAAMEEDRGCSDMKEDDKASMNSEIEAVERLAKEEDDKANTNSRSEAMKRVAEKLDHKTETGLDKVSQAFLGFLKNLKS